MTLRPEYSLGHSQYNAFLFAEVGEEEVGKPLTVLSALTRLGLDPWKEAARLSDLPKEAAVRALAALVARLPEGVWRAADSEAIAARLVNWLPGRSAQPVPPVKAARGEGAPAAGGTRERAGGEARRRPWLVWGVLAIAAIFLTLQLQVDHNLEPVSSSGALTQQ